MRKIFNSILFIFRKRPKLQIKLKHFIKYSDGTEKEVSEEEAYNHYGCRITFKQN